MVSSSRWMRKDRQRRQHGADLHIERPEALVAVADCRIDEAHFVAHNSSGIPFKGSRFKVQRSDGSIRSSRSKGSNPGRL
jgi:hypothetical protein